MDSISFSDGDLSKQCVVLPRERLILGENSCLSDEDLLSVVLGRGNTGKNVFVLAKEVAQFLRLRSKMPSVEELSVIRGLGSAKASQIVACLELSTRFILGHEDKAVHGPAELMPRLAFLKYQAQEHMVLVTLNGGNRVVGVHVVTKGLANQAPVHPREAFALALQDRAVAVILAHNHPSGSLEPSTEDCSVTRCLCRAGRILDIPVLDHMIISMQGYRSLKAWRPELFEE